MAINPTPTPSGQSLNWEAVALGATIGTVVGSFVGTLLAGIHRQASQHMRDHPRHQHGHLLGGRGAPAPRHSRR